MAANGIIFGLAYQNFDNSLEYYYLRSILKVWSKVTMQSEIVLHIKGQGSVGACVIAGYTVQGHRIENEQKGHLSRTFEVCELCPHAFRITHVHYAGSGQSIAFSGQ